MSLEKSFYSHNYHRVTYFRYNLSSVIFYFLINKSTVSKWAYPLLARNDPFHHAGIINDIQIQNIADHFYSRNYVYPFHSKDDPKSPLNQIPTIKLRHYLYRISYLPFQKYLVTELLYFSNEKISIGKAKRQTSDGKFLNENETVTFFETKRKLWENNVTTREIEKLVMYMGRNIAEFCNASLKKRSRRRW